jgi:hypothetical protein
MGIRAERCLKEATQGRKGRGERKGRESGTHLSRLGVLGGLKWGTEMRGTHITPEEESLCPQRVLDDTQTLAALHAPVEGQGGGAGADWEQRRGGVLVCRRDEEVWSSPPHRIAGRGDGGRATLNEVPVVERERDIHEVVQGGEGGAGWI